MRLVQFAKPAVALSTLTFVLLRAAPALAQEGRFGSEHQLVLSAERLAGVYWLDANSDANGTTEVGPATANTSVQIDDSGTKVAFLGNDGGVDFSTVPRVGFDFFVIPSLSLGASFIYINDSDESDTSGTASAPNVGTFTLPDVHTDTSRNGFIIAPRVGYGVQFADHLGFWGRGGITYGSQKEEVDETTTAANGNITRVETTTKLSLLTLSLDAQLIIIPVQHFGIGVGGFIEIPLTGSIDFEQNDDGTVTQFDGDLSALSAGLTATLLGWL
jgi:hypothetical protein